MSKSIDPMLFLKSGTRPFPASPRSHRFDEFAVGYSLAVCSPAWPAPALPASFHLQTAGSYLSTGFLRENIKTGLEGPDKAKYQVRVGQIRVSKWARPEYQTHSPHRSAW